MDGADQMGIKMEPEKADRLAEHAEMLMLWSRKMNLTAIRDPVDVAVKHYLDSLAPVSLIPRNTRLLDVGSGGGFPGIPLKIMIPSLSGTLVDASRRKVSFLKQTIRALALTSIDAVQGRVEALVSTTLYDVIISRAVSDLATFFRRGAPLLAKDGVLMAFKSMDVSSEIASLKGHNPEKREPEACLPDQFDVDVYPYRLPYVELKRSLVLIRRRGGKAFHAP